MAKTAAERKREQRERERTSSLHRLANRRQERAAADGVVARYVQMYDGIRAGAQAAAALALQGIGEAQQLAAKGGAHNIREAVRRADASLVLLRSAQEQLPAPAAEPPPLSVALPRRPGESRSDYAALVKWYQDGCRTDPPDGNLDWVARAALASAYSAMDEGYGERQNRGSARAAGQRACAAHPLRQDGA